MLCTVSAQSTTGRTGTTYMLGALGAAGSAETSYAGTERVRQHRARHRRVITCGWQTRTSLGRVCGQPC